MNRRSILQVYPTLGGPEEMARRRPIGRDNEAWQLMLASLSRMVRHADDFGYWGITHVEHHFHSEGLEVSPDPGLLNLYLGLQTKRMKHGQLGYVLPSRDPIRLAEETALIDHMLQGRFFVGMARGYQTRWQNVLGQHFHVTATPMDQGEIDVKNRELFYEHYKLLKMAWTEDLLRVKTEHYEVPYPFEAGIQGWPPGKTITAQYGVPGEVDENGTVRGVATVPRPYQRPHPPLFQAFSVSEATLRWCAREGIVPTVLFGPMDVVENLARAYHEEAVANGNAFGFGERIGLVRSIHVVDSHEELLAAVEKYDVPVWRWYEPFGFAEVLREPGEEGPVPKPGESFAERLISSGLVIGGTADDVKRQLDAVINRVPFEYLIWLYHWGIYEEDYGLRQLERFAQEIAPEFGFAPPEEVVAG